MASTRGPIEPIAAWRAVGITAMAVLATHGFQLLIAGSFMVVRGTDLAEAVARVSVHPLSLATAQILGFGAVLTMGARRLVRGPLRGALGVDPPSSLGLLGLCLLAGLALQPPLSELGNAVRELVPMPLETQLARQRLVEPRNLVEGVGALFAFVIVAPLMEELLFRGLLLPGLERRHGPGPAVLVSALLFGLVHLDWSGSLYAFVAGLLLGALRLRAGSLWPCVTLHAAVNSVPLLVPRALWPVPGFNVPSAEVQHIPPALLFGSLAVAAAALAMVERSTRAAA